MPARLAASKNWPGPIGACEPDVNRRRGPATDRRLVTAAMVTAAATVVAIGLAVVRSERSGTERAPIDDRSVVLLGDSITEFGDWQRLLPGRATVNQGHAGFTTAQLVPVAEEVADRRPRTVLILTGTNDIRDGHPPSWTIEHLEQILAAFEERSPATALVIQTVLPRSDAPAEVRAVNAALANLAARRDLALLDLHPVFDDGTGGLRDEETTDGIHLSGQGYERWATRLASFLDASDL